MNFFSSNIRILRLRKKRTQIEVASALELKRTTINALENSISQPTVPQLQAFSKYFGIAIDTLINVDLKTLSESQFADLRNGFDVFIRGTKIRVIAITVDSHNNDNIEFVNEKAHAGYAAGFADAEFIEKLPVFQLPFLLKEKKYRAFKIKGDSMLPVPDGAVIIGEYVQDFYSIVSGSACIVLTREDGLVFKIAENLIKDEKRLKLSSLNKLYEPFYIEVNEIQEVWKFAGYLNTELPEPINENEKLMKLITGLQNDISFLKENIKG